MFGLGMPELIPGYAKEERVGPHARDYYDQGRLGHRIARQKCRRSCLKCIAFPKAAGRGPVDHTD
jgi:hypothetical protein